jgi:predicted PurR-regulated permease PerM
VSSFGILAVLLELIPFVGIVFAFTNTIGAALWASDMEQLRTTAPNLQQQAELARKAE